MAEPAPVLDDAPALGLAPWKRWLGLAVVALVFILAIAAIHAEIRHLSVHKIYAELRALSASQILLALAGVLVSYVAITGYDTLALRYARKRLAYGMTAFASFTSYALSNTLGLPLLTGGAVRYRLYSVWGLTAKQISVLAIVTGITLYIGALAIGGAGLILEAARFETVFHIPAALAYALGAICLAAVCAFLFLAGQPGRTRRVRSVEFTTPGLPVATGQLVISMADWAGASLVLFAVLPPDTGLSYLTFLPVFVAACFLGGISGLPGGVGVFEAVILLMVPTESNEALAASLIAYRVLYYLIPLGVAAVLLAAHQVPNAGKQLKGAATRAQDITEIFAPQVFSLIAFISGAFMLISATTPTLAGPLEAAADILPLPVIELSHFLASIIGVLLLIVALGLRQKLDHAWTIGMILLMLGAGLTLLKGADPHEAIILVVSLALLATSRKAFYRKTPLSQARLTLPWILAILGAISAAVWLGFFSYEHVAYRDELWWSFSVNGQTSRFLRVIAALPIVLLLASLWRWLQPAITKSGTPGPVDPAVLKQILDTAEFGYSDGGLALLGDKQFLMSPSGQSFIMYGVRGRHWIAMSEPVGKRDEISPLVWAYREQADVYGAVPVFYSVRKGFLPLALDLGLTAQKIGETALVPLQAFSLEGPARSGLRASHKRALRDGLSFDVIAQGGCEDDLPTLRTISDEWLAIHGGAEKSFSLGRFDPDYLRHFPIAVARLEGNIVAFANLMSTADGREMAIDLMRYGHAAPKGVMDFLFIELMLWGKAQGVQTFDLGMAPLSGLEDHRLATLTSKLGAFVYEHANKIYGFEGLRNYKKKFDPDWEPLYLVAPAGLSLPIALGDVAMLTSGGLKGMFSKG
ncbi:bifunctional lysylphosphatidylglycerol flippase/synthetase MprF [Hyphomonas johnsonii]|uniref:Putative membrane protein n=1 Tax=Hyphomonas johnsonii MHS-2 TaxID=1280950 RepID=A0A059FRH7_9PROT|nr:bifunctional lysylphosphatidylglycerol flippase/synthetase MprF [Hyphomonas johnsonii]KCZ93279.1 putative membrane protein [Hyphomonas johnsonii MHS-2]